MGLIGKVCLDSGQTFSFYSINTYFFNTYLVKSVDHQRLKDYYLLD